MDKTMDKLLYQLLDVIYQQFNVSSQEKYTFCWQFI